MEAVEATRARFRPERITTLFVGESAPASGDFFYYGDNAMLGYMRQAVEHSPATAEISLRASRPTAGISTIWC